MKKIFINFPHQLFENLDHLKGLDEVYLIESFLFFRHYNFHKQKIAFHRSSMQYYAAFLKTQNIVTHYIDSTDPRSDIRVFLKSFNNTNAELFYIDPTDDWLNKRIISTCKKQGINFQILDSPLFINTKKDNETFFRSDKKKFFHAKFYINQRKRLNILIDEDKKPLGGKWSYDTENRKKYPKQKRPPKLLTIKQDKYNLEAVEYVKTHFKNNLGDLHHGIQYPSNHKTALTWLDDFLDNRFNEFGIYEDAIVAGEHFLNHSVLTPMLNVGLLTPDQIIKKSLAKARELNIPLNSLEGFVRQIIGWREFIRGIYEAKGKQERTSNFWGFKRKIPSSFYEGTTGILPIDQTIKKILKTAYCHHIERLMILGNFMLLCEFDPDEVYRWFMELFIDAYDWVMVPNVYGMSQFADGGLMSTKPYFSSSNYLKKMSNYPKGDWQETWDALFWRFMHVHRDFFLKNPRMGMLIRTFDKKSAAEKENLITKGNKYLLSLD